MSKQHGNKKRANALYYSLAVCVVASFVAAFSIFGSSPKSDATSDIGTTKIVEEKEVVAPVTDAHDTRGEEGATDVLGNPTETTTQTPDYMAELNKNIPFESKYQLPLSTKISRDYSDGELVYSEINGDYRQHNGIDFPGESGTPVRAIISGQVLGVHTDADFGTVIEINHGNKLIARYCGIDNPTVQEGDFVTQGDEIGSVGLVPCEGTARHIHFETVIDGAYTDPLAVMGKAG